MTCLHSASFVIINHQTVVKLWVILKWLFHACHNCLLVFPRRVLSHQSFTKKPEVRVILAWVVKEMTPHKQPSWLNDFPWLLVISFQERTPFLEWSVMASSLDMPVILAWVCVVKWLVKTWMTSMTTVFSEREEHQVMMMIESHLQTKVTHTDKHTLSITISDAKWRTGRKSRRMQEKQQKDYNRVCWLWFPCTLRSMSWSNVRFCLCLWDHHWLLRSSLWQEVSLCPSFLSCLSGTETQCDISSTLMLERHFLLVMQSSCISWEETRRWRSVHLFLLVLEHHSIFVVDSCVRSSLRFNDFRTILVFSVDTLVLDTHTCHEELKMTSDER